MQNYTMHIIIVWYKFAKNIEKLPHNVYNRPSILYAGGDFIMSNDINTRESLIKIKVIGAGGGGSNAVNRMITDEVENVNTGHPSIEWYEQRHQDDCITINQLYTTIDVIVDRYANLRKNKGMC